MYLAAYFGVLEICTFVGAFIMSAGAEPPPESAAGPRTLLILQNPARSDGFPLEVPLDASLAQVQELISKNYPGHPVASEQTVS